MGDFLADTGIWGWRVWAEVE